MQSENLLEPDLDHGRWFFSVCFFLINYLYNRDLVHVWCVWGGSVEQRGGCSSLWSRGFPHTHSAGWQAHSSNHGSSRINWTPQRQAAGPPGALWDISGLQPIDKLPPLTDGEQIYTSDSRRWIRSPSSTHQPFAADSPDWNSLAL